MKHIYLDHNATTPLSPEVWQEMVAASEVFGNPSSLHWAGNLARRCLEEARKRVSELIGAQQNEIIFTSGGTEGNNIALFGTVYALAHPTIIVTSGIEHQSVLNPCRFLEKQGHQVIFVQADTNGIIRFDELATLLKKDVGLVSVMFANNDTGVIQPIREIAAIAHKAGAIVHCDGVQAVGKIPVDVRKLGVDLLTFSAHKFNGPKGIGALFIRRGIDIDSLLLGGHQESNLRPGTENTLAIAGFGKACELIANDSSRHSYLSGLRDLFEKEIKSAIPDIQINGENVDRVPNTTSLSIPGIRGDFLALNLDICGLAVSTGSACTTVDKQPSHVLLAMGRTAREAESTIRVSFGISNTEEEVQQAVEIIASNVRTLRKTN